MPPKRRRSPNYTALMRRHFPNLAGDKDAIARRLRIPRKRVDMIYDRGVKSWSPNKAAPGVTAWQWGWARLYKFVLIDREKIKLSPTDPDLALHRTRVINRMT